MLVPIKKQKGFALITVLLVLALMLTVAATMTGRLTYSLKRTEGLSLSQKVYWYGQAASELGRMVLNEDFADSDVTSLDQIWATPDMTFPLDNGYIAGEIKDQRSCFNVNAVNKSDVAQEQFEVLLKEIGVEEYSAEIIAESTRDWIDENDQSSSSQGAEDSFYQGMKVGHLAANNIMTDITELRAVQGVTKKVYRQIQPYLCALPSVDQKINVNTVSEEQPEILYALFNLESLTSADFKLLLNDRPTSGWSDVDEFLASGLFTDIKTTSSIKDQLAVDSEFFQFDGVADFDERMQAFKFLFHIKEKKANLIRYQSGGIK